MLRNQKFDTFPLIIVGIKWQNAFIFMWKKNLVFKWWPHSWPHHVYPCPAMKMSSAKCLVCINFQSTSKSFKICETVVLVSNSLVPDETPSYSASHPDPSCLNMALWSRVYNATAVSIISLYFDLHDCTLYINACIIQNKFSSLATRTVRYVACP